MKFFTEIVFTKNYITRSDTTRCQPVTDPGFCNKRNADVLLFQYTDVLNDRHSHTNLVSVELKTDMDISCTSIL